LVASTYESRGRLALEVLVPELAPQLRPEGAHPAIVPPARPAGNTHRSAALAGWSVDLG
jgi:hypothetical protein